ncbi:F-box/kelch-repeat protein At3g06240-like [Cornus florida]|uniref:F-box/kelch-repeat protein At3g06240-like n=1 Tax=Cornus florida TaxID=4283 RepID=UPI00289D9DAC|nr:F-box/kelch-repeat protein At3g06240-like [Cornus florida]
MGNVVHTDLGTTTPLMITSLMRFKCVSKSCLSLISSTYFAKTHLNESFTNPNIQRQQTLVCTRSPGHDRFYAYNLQSDKRMVKEVEMNYIDHGNMVPWKLEFVDSCNGLLGWTFGTSNGDDKRQMIAAFDLVEEKFRVVPVPAATLICRDIQELMIMKEYGLQQSWTKLVITIPYTQIHLLRMLKSDEALLRIDYHKLVLYNITEGTYRVLVYPDIERDGNMSLAQGTYFVESLISPSYMSQYEAR